MYPRWKFESSAFYCKVCNNTRHIYQTIIWYTYEANFCENSCFVGTMTKLIQRDVEFCQLIRKWFYINEIRVISIIFLVSFSIKISENHSTTILQNYLLLINQNISNFLEFDYSSSPKYFSHRVTTVWRSYCVLRRTISHVFYVIHACSFDWFKCKSQIHVFTSIHISKLCVISVSQWRVHTSPSYFHDASSFRISKRLLLTTVWFLFAVVFFFL